MAVPLLDLKLQYAQIKEQVEDALIRVSSSQALILGAETARLEEQLAAYTGCTYALGVSSGTDALLMALMALDIQPGDEVIIPTYSFFATAGVVARLNAIPVLVDADPVSFNINPKHIESAITPRTKAIMPVHLYGQCADMDAILAIGTAHGIPVIEDGAQALGTVYKDGRPAGSMGLMGCFSFYPTKNLGAFGDAGLITTNDKDLYIKLKQMRNHGMEPRYYHKFVGGNFRIDEIQSAVLNVKFPHLDTWHQGRRRNAVLYTELFTESGLATGTGVTEFSADNKVLLPAMVYADSPYPNTHIFNQYIIRVQRRNALRAYLTEQGIGSEIYYPVPFHKQECFTYLNLNDAQFPVADCCANDSLALPIFPELREEQIREVVRAIAEFERTVSANHTMECSHCTCMKG
ncbi:MAG: DegT/DnrJ/EryC1/StrS family aminotransferase [Candidatus Kapabacteria bacterium]|nr:DegT/DnrJ/EryC1/StrS family aminotransferase [Candidatus Kapabacteria bacterium]